jgi:hypothetical protein
MTTLDDLSLQLEFQNDLVVFKRQYKSLCLEWKDQASKGKDISEATLLTAKAALGRLKKLNDAYYSDPTTYDAIFSSLGLTTEHVLGELASYRSTMESFRDAPRDDSKKVLDAVNSLGISFEITKTYLYAPTPLDWVSDVKTVSSPPSKMDAA